MDRKLCSYLFVNIPSILFKLVTCISTFTYKEHLTKCAVVILLMNVCYWINALEGIKDPTLGP